MLINVPGATLLCLRVNAGNDQTTVQLNSGDHLALYTAGSSKLATETANSTNLNLCKNFRCQSFGPRSGEAAVRFGQDDDVTVVTLANIGESEQACANDEIRPELAPQ